MANHIWIGLADVRPIAGADPFDGAVGAYAYAAVEASDEAAFDARVRLAAQQLGLTVVDIEEASPALAKGVRALSGDQRRVISDARQASEVAWGTFHAYENDDE